jgi:regulation of enolase protein 1 (concanavalin A-like superfamily)
MINRLTACSGRRLGKGLNWLNEPPEWSCHEGVLHIVPAAPSDFFRPFGGGGNDNCCLLYEQVAGDFTAVASVRARLADYGDAAAVTVRASDRQWAKLCLERSPVGEVSLVSVVTDPWSDDSNSERVVEPECFMRLTRKGPVFGMHYSLDGRRWRFVRMFHMDAPEQVMVGIHAQAPFTPGCEAFFSSFSISPEPVPDFRSGD